MSSDFDLIKAEILLGDEARRFVVSSLGQFMLQRAKSQEDEAIKALIEVNSWSPFARRKMRRLQNEINQARQFIDWINELIMNGDAALSQLDEL